MAKLKKRDDGYFRAWYKGKQFLGKTEKEARDKRDAYKYEVEHGIAQICQKTVMEYSCEWLPLAKADVCVQTYNKHVKSLERLCDVCGNKFLSDVTPKDAMKVWKAYVGMSLGVIRHASGLYRTMFDSAIENGYCTINPFRSKSVKQPHGTVGSHRSLTAEEQELVKTVPHRCQAAAMCMMCEGLRRAEMFAISDKNIHDGRLWVDSSVRFQYNAPIQRETKTPQSKRSIPIFKDFEPFTHFKGYLMQTTVGTQCSEQSWTRAWKSYMAKLSEVAKHPIKFCPYDLRHTFVTNMLDLGVDLHVLIEWCGHKDEQMIMRVYDHVGKDRESLAVNIVNNSKKTVTQETVTAENVENQQEEEAV